ncbi:MAG: redoxin domain-containing protein [Tepidiformaceae bacterium]
MTEREAPEVAIRPKPLTAGEQAPQFSLPAVDAEGGQSMATLSELVRIGPVMLVFYQDDGMPICTSELKVFAQEHGLLEQAGVQVYGINTNGIGSHQKFQERDHFPFPLISDFYGEVVKTWGMWDADDGKSKRGVVIVGEDGLVTYVQPHFNPGNVNALVEVFEALGLV